MTSSRRRDRTKIYFPEYALAKFPVTSVFRLALWMTGVLGLVGGGAGAASGQSPYPNMFQKASVLAAAPTSSTCVFPPNLARTSWNAPPPYRMWELMNISPVERIPSSSYNTPPSMLFSLNTRDKGGTTGTYGLVPAGATGDGDDVDFAGDSWAKATSGCTKVEMWFPFPKSDMQTAPTMNDPNATITVRITPPSSGNAGNCVVRKNHYRVRPKAKTRIREGAKSTTAGLTGEHHGSGTA